MKALITGASGFVGQHLADLLAAEGIEVSGIGHHDIHPENMDYLKVDLLNPAELDALKEEFDWVFHLAGLAAVGASFEAPATYIDANARMQINLFEHFIKSRSKPRVLVISTGALYDSNAKLPLSEKSPLNPSSPYAVSKITQEALAAYYENRGFEVLIARPFNHIGPGQQKGFLIPDLASQIVESINEIKVGDLSHKRDFTDVRDIVKAYLLLMQKGKSGEIYNVCSGRSVSGEEILNKLVKLSHAKVTVTQDESKIRPSDISDIYGSYEKLQKDTGWQPEIDLDATLTDVLDDWRQRVAAS